MDTRTIASLVSAVVLIGGILWAGGDLRGQIRQAVVEIEALKAADASLRANFKAADTENRDRMELRIREEVELSRAGDRDMAARLNARIDRQVAQRREIESRLISYIVDNTQEIHELKGAKKECRQ